MRGSCGCGPAVAAFTPAQVSAFRRIHDRLPTAPDADGSGEQDDQGEGEQ